MARVEMFIEVVVRAVRQEGARLAALIIMWQYGAGEGVPPGEYAEARRAITLSAPACDVPLMPAAPGGRRSHRHRNKKKNVAQLVANARCWLRSRTPSPYVQDKHS